MLCDSSCFCPLHLLFLLYLPLLLDNFYKCALLLLHESEPRKCWNVCPQLLPLRAQSRYSFPVLTQLSFKCAPVQWLGRFGGCRNCQKTQSWSQGIPSAEILLHLAAEEGECVNPPFV